MTATREAQAEEIVADNNRGVIRSITRAQATQIVLVLLGMMVLFTIINPDAFLSVFNFRSIIVNASIFIILGVGVTFVIVTAGIDLSIGSVLVFAVFIGIAYLLRKLSFDTDKTGDINNTHLARRLSSAGLFLCAVFATVGAIDWFKSLEYHWFSTMYGVWFFAASMRAALSALIILCIVLAAKGYLKGILKQAHRYDIGCLMLTFTIFWAYISFSQYFLIYNANIPEETFWYNIREKNFTGELNSWWWVSMGLIFGHFLAPFLILLWYKTKVVAWRSIAIASWILGFHLLDLYWNIVPGKLADPDSHGAGYIVRQFSVSVFDIAAVIGVGGLCVWAFCNSTKKAEPIPVRDPNIVKSLNYVE